MQLQYETEADVPQEHKESFQSFEQDGKTVFMHKDLAASKIESYKQKGQVTDLSNKFTQFQDTINDQKAQAVKQAEDLKAAELADEIESLKQAGKHSEVNKIEQQQREAEYQKTLDALTAKDDELNSLKTSITDGKREVLASKITQAFADPDYAALVMPAIMARTVSSDGVVAMTDLNGNAVATDIESIVEMLSEEAGFKPTAKKPASKAGVVAQGGSQKNNVNPSDKPWSELSNAEKADRIKRKK